jgi:hypothetical protein
MACGEETVGDQLQATLRQKPEGRSYSLTDRPLLSESVQLTFCASSADVAKLETTELDLGMTFKLPLELQT